MYIVIDESNNVTVTVVIYRYNLLILNLWLSVNWNNQCSLSDVRRVYLLLATHATRRVSWRTCSEYPFSFWRSGFLCCMCYCNRFENGWKFTPLRSCSPHSKIARIWPVSCPTGSNRGQTTAPGSLPPDGRRPNYWSSFVPGVAPTETSYWSIFVLARRQSRPNFWSFPSHLTATAPEL